MAQPDGGGDRHQGSGLKLFINFFTYAQMNLFYEFSTGARARTWRGTLRSRDGESGATRDPRSPRGAVAARPRPPPPARTSASARTRVVMASTLLQRCFIHTPLTPPPHDVSLFMLYLSAIR